MQVNIEITNTVDNAVARLQHFLAADRSISGTVSESTVRIIRTQSLGNSIFRPEFNGTFTSTPAGCSLHGDFRLSDQATGLMKAWFLGMSSLAIIAAVMGIRTGYSEWWAVPLGGLRVLLGGVLFVWFANYYYRADRDWIVQQLRTRLGTGNTQTARPN